MPPALDRSAKHLQMQMQRVVRFLFIESLSTKQIKHLRPDRRVDNTLAAW